MTMLGGEEKNTLSRGVVSHVHVVLGFFFLGTKTGINQDINHKARY